MTIFLCLVPFYEAFGDQGTVTVSLSSPLTLTSDTTQPETSWVYAKESRLADNEALVGELKWSSVFGTQEKIIYVRWLGLQHLSRPKEIVYLHSPFTSHLHTHQQLLPAGQIMLMHGIEKTYADALQKLKLGQMQRFDEKEPKLLTTIKRVFTAYMESILLRHEDAQDYEMEDFIT